jgi:ATP-dependent DNA helicase RecG
MTATPIPRTLTMSLYGDLDLSVIDELPPGRKDVITVNRKDKNRLKVFGFIKDQIKKGRQIYVVYPLIEESKKMDLKFLEDGYESIVKEFDSQKYSVGVMHGRMKTQNKDFEMIQFAEGKTDILVSTTVIEVGVNVPNASVMIIENAERFGLSQLHQLRGRVGRGTYDSYCILMTKDKISEDAKVRIDAMVQTNDGFKISEVDLKLRGPGNILGTQQSGVLDFKIADLIEDEDILLDASNDASVLLKNDSKLILNENYNIRRFILNNPINKSWNEIG